MLGYGYCRYSSHMQDEKSIEQQKMEIEEYCSRNDIQVIKYYIDEAKSGTKDNRDGFQAMIKDACENKDIKCVLVWKTDRFARNTQDNLYFKSKLAKHGTKLISITQPIDDSTPEGNMMSIMLAAMDQYYSENLASNIRRAQKLKAKSFEFNGGTAPLGFDIIDKHYVINEKEAIIIRKIFEFYINGHGLLDIADILNKSGYTTKKGNSFGKNSIYEILSNEKYIGTYTFNKAYRHDRHTKRNDTISYEGALPAIIKKEDFEKVQEIRNTRKKPGSFSSKKVYLLSALIVCGNCGANYCGRTSKKTKNGKTFETGYYQCGNRNKLGKCKNPILKQVELEKAIINLLTDKLLNSTDIDELVNKVNAQYKEIYKNSFEETKNIERDLRENQKKIDNAINLMVDGFVSDELKQKLKDLEEIKINLNEALVSSKNINRTPQFTADIIKFILKKDANKLLKNEQSKEIIGKWVEKIEVYENEIIVHFNLDKNSSSCMVAGDRLELSTFGL